MDKMLIIKLGKLDIYEFCERCESFYSDIDLIDGSTVLDAKDYDHIIIMDLSRNFCASINSNDEIEIKRFTKVMDKYKVR